MEHIHIFLADREPCSGRKCKSLINISKVVTPKPFTLMFLSLECPPLHTGEQKIKSKHQLPFLWPSFQVLSNASSAFEMPLHLNISFCFQDVSSDYKYVSK